MDHHVRLGALTGAANERAGKGDFTEVTLSSAVAWDEGQNTENIHVGAVVNGDARNTTLRKQLCGVARWKMLSHG